MEDIKVDLMSQHRTKSAEIVFTTYLGLLEGNPGEARGYGTIHSERLKKKIIAKFT